MQCKSKLVGYNTFCIVKPSSRPPPTAGRFHRPQGRFHLTKSNFTRQRRISLSYILSDTMVVIYRRNLRSVKKYKKTPTLLGGHFMCWHLPIFPGRHQPSIFGTTELNFCVRYGNRWTLSVINTNYSFVFKSLSAFLAFGDSCGNRTRVAGVRGRSLNRLTNEPCLSSQRLMVFALISPCNFSWCTIRGSNPGHPD